MNIKKGLHLNKTLLTVLLTLVVVSTLVYNLYLLFDCSAYFENESKSIAQRYASQTVSLIQNDLTASFNDVVTIASEVRTVSGFEQIDVFGTDKAEQYGFNCLQFFKDGNAEYRYGEGVGSSTSPHIVKLVQDGVFACSEIYDDLALGAPCIAVYAPVTGSNEIDGVLGYYAVTDTFIGVNKLSEFTKYYCFARSDGSILESYSADGFKTDVSHNIFTYLYNLTESKPAIDPVQEGTSKGIGEAYAISIDGEGYIVSSIPVIGFGIKCFAVQIFSVHELLQNEYTLYDKVCGVSIMLAIITVITLISFAVVKHNNDKQLMIIDEFDPLLGCNSYNKFLRSASEILAVNRFSSYAVVCFAISKYSYIKANYDTETTEGLLKYISNIVKKMVGPNETYGHVIDDQFVILLHFSDMQELGDRIKIMCALIENYEQFKQMGRTLSLSVGVFVVEREHEMSVQEMIDRASIAQKANQTIEKQQFVVYDTTIRSSFVREAEIESKMELALKNDDFKLFFQPKYGITSNRVDSAEVLVRWYDPVTNAYVAPDSFIHIFEVNGFISKIDRYVLIETFKFLNESTHRGEKVIPVSVNVSRVTATQPDFLSFYVKSKKDYKIPDNFVTLEFTESFAYENYETLGEIIATLKINGYLCAIDDFGAGYSSFSILKELPMDELKMDKFFLNPGTDSAKDETLIETVVSLGKSFGMKVTQEGVETNEDLTRLTRFGCDVIQGYYYSKPIPMSDYIDFINGDTSIESIKNMYSKSIRNNPAFH